MKEIPLEDIKFYLTQHFATVSHIWGKLDSGYKGKGVHLTPYECAHIMHSFLFIHDQNLITREGNQFLEFCRKLHGVDENKTK